MCSKIGLQGLAVPRAEMQNCHISLRRIEILYLNYVVSGGKFASPHKDNLDPLDGSSPPPFPIQKLRLALFLEDQNLNFIMRYQCEEGRGAGKERMIH